MKLGMVRTMVAGLALFAGAASAAEITGKITASEETKVVLDDGTEIWATQGMKLPRMEEGKKVTVSYEEQEGRKVVIGIEVVSE